MKRYFDLTDAEKLALNQDQLDQAIKLESLNRGIKLPFTHTEAMKQEGYNGFQFPPDTLKLYQIIIPNEYGNPEKTGVCYKTIEEARQAIVGVICIAEVGYPHKQNKICSASCSIQETYITNQPAHSFFSKLELVEETNEAFQKLVEECVNNLSEIRQAAYNKKVRTQKREQYLTLANNDEQIAKNFWAKTEGTEWPTE